MLSRISHIVLKYPKLVLTGIGIVTAIFAYIAFLSPTRLEVDFSLEQMFPENDPHKDEYLKFLDDFTREDDILFLTYSGIDPLNRDHVETITDITEELEFLGSVEGVLSLGNLEYGEFFDPYLSDEEWQDKRDDVLNHPIYTNLVVSRDGHTGGLIINLQDDVVGQERREDALNEIHEVLKTVGWEWHEAGVPIFRTRYIQFVISERKIFLPLAFLVTTLVLFFIFRQVKGVLLPFAAIGAALIWVAGLMALLGITVNVVSYLTFNLLMIIGVSDCIHILIKYHENLNRGFEKIKALDSVIKAIGSALFLTSFTTAVGFFSLTMTNITVTREFGLILGIGVILMFFLTIIILPILLNFIDVPDDVHIQRLIRGGRFQAAEQLTIFNERHPRIILGSTVIIFILAIYGLTQLSYNASIMDDLSPGNSLYDDIKFVETHMGGTFPVEIILDTHERGGILSPEFLTGLDQLREKVLSTPEIGYVVSIADHLQILNEKIGDGVRAIPSDSDDALSYLVDYEPGKHLRTSDYSKARMSARIINIPTDRAFEIRDTILRNAKEIFPADVDCIITGSTILALYTNRHLVKNLTFSFMVAFVIIFISMVFLFKSFRLALMSVLPNIIPLMIAGGLMGYLHIKLRPSTAMTFSIALGIAVDDTIHFLSRFRQEYKHSGNHREAINKTLLTTGKAIISTTIILSLGFMVLIFSRFVPNHEFGILATIILVVALAGSLILLPVMILLIKPTFRFRRPPSDENVV
ncbi:MAG: MMPL family transporter [Candidatus Marinimicrobia bacterium]|nr:MMPL family transporter [Candidatus Neomarinimicrobiota bacterium]